MNKKSWKGICIILILVFLFVILFIECNKEQKKVEIADTVIEILEMENISKCYIKKLADYEKIYVYIDNPQISSDEIANYIQEKINDYNQKKLTEQFVKETFGYDSIEEYESSIEKTLLEQKKIEKLMEARENIKNELIALSEFVINEEEIVEYSMDIVKGYETEAYLSGMTIQDYSKEILGVSYDDFFEMCYEEGEELIKTYLVMGAIYNIEFSKDELEGEDVFLKYQEMENSVYSLLIETEQGF